MHTNNITVPNDSLTVVFAVSVSEIKPFRLLSFGKDNIIIYIFVSFLFYLFEFRRVRSLVVL